MDNYILQLNNYAQKEHFPLPDYKFTKQENNGVFSFKCQLSFANHNYVSKYYINKNQAKQEVAEQMWNALNKSQRSNFKYTTQIIEKLDLLSISRRFKVIVDFEYDNLFQIHAPALDFVHPEYGRIVITKLSVRRTVVGKQLYQIVFIIDIADHKHIESVAECILKEIF